MTETTNMFGSEYIETIDDFFAYVDDRDRIALAVDDEGKVRKDVAGILVATDRFLPGRTNVLQQIVASLPEGVIAPETPALDEASILLTPSGEHALTLSWELYDKGVQATVKVVDINIERGQEQTRIPMNGLQAASYMAGFDRAPIIVYTAYAKEHLAQSRFESSVPMLLVEKGPTSLDTLKDVVVAAQHYADVMAQLHVTLRKREEYVSGLVSTTKELKKRLGVNRSEDYQLLKYGDLSINIIIVGDIHRILQRVPTYDGFELDALSKEMKATFETLYTKASIVNDYNIQKEYNDLTTRVSETSRNIKTVRDAFASVQAMVDSKALEETVYDHVQTAENTLNPDTTWTDILAFDDSPTRSKLSYVTERVTKSIPETVAVNYSPAPEGEYDTQRLGLVALGIRQALVAYDTALVTAGIKAARDPVETQLEMTYVGESLQVVCSFRVSEEKKDMVQIYFGAQLQDTMCGQIFRKADPSFSPEMLNITKTQAGIQVCVELEKRNLYPPL